MTWQGRWIHFISEAWKTTFPALVAGSWLVQRSSKELIAIASDSLSWARKWLVCSSCSVLRWLLSEVVIFQSVRQRTTEHEKCIRNASKCTESKPQGCSSLKSYIALQCSTHPLLPAPALLQVSGPGGVIFANGWQVSHGICAKRLKGEIYGMLCLVKTNKWYNIWLLTTVFQHHLIIGHLQSSKTAQPHKAQGIQNHRAAYTYEYAFKMMPMFMEFLPLGSSWHLLTKKCCVSTSFWSEHLFIGNPIL